MSRQSRHGYPRRSYRSALRHFVRRNWRPFTVLGLSYLGVLALLSFIMRGFFLGFVTGGLLTAFVGMVLIFGVVTTGTLSQVVGSWGEDNTRDLLIRAKRRGLIFGWVDNVEVEGGDVDHLVAAPAGWFAIDSKWHSRSFDSRLVAQDAERAKRSARRASLILLSLKHRADVTPVAVCWGGTRDEIPGGHTVAHDVHFLAGTQLKRWLRELPEGQLDRATAMPVLEELRRFRARVQPGDRRSGGQIATASAHRKERTTVTA